MSDNSGDTDATTTTPSLAPSLPSQQSAGVSPSPPPAASSPSDLSPSPSPPPLPAAASSSTAGPQQPSASSSSSSSPAKDDALSFAERSKVVDFIEDAPASQLVPLPTAGFYPPICQGFEPTDQEYDRAHVVSSFGIEAHIYDPKAKREVNLPVHGPSCPSSFTGRFRDSVVDPFLGQEGRAKTETGQAKEMARSRPVNDVYMPVQGRRCADPRVYGGDTSTVVLRDYTCNLKVSPAIVEQAVAAAISSYPQAYMHFMKSFVDATMGASMKAFLEDTMISGIETAERPAVSKALNVHSWKLLCLLGRPFGPDGSHADVTAVGTDLEVSDDAFSKMCPFFEIFSALQDHLQTYYRLSELCAGFATSPESAVLMIHVCNLWGVQWCEDAMLVDPETNTPDYSRVEMQVPMNLNVGKDNRMHSIPDWEETSVMHSIPSCNPTISSTLQQESDCDQVVHVPAFGIPVGEWMGTLPIGLDVMSSSSKGAAKSSGLDMTSGITAEALTAAGGYRWGFGHSAFTFPRLSSGAYSNYFTPYRITEDGHREVNLEDFPIRIAVCRNWGADLFNDPDGFGLAKIQSQKERARTAESGAGDEDEHLLRSGSGGEAKYAGLTSPSFVSIKDVIGMSFTMTSPGVFMVVPIGGGEVGGERRPASACASRPLHNDNLPPYGPCSLRHNESSFQLSVSPAPFSASTDLDRCLTLSEDRKAIHVSTTMIYEGRAPLSTGASMTVELEPKVGDQATAQKLATRWQGRSTSSVSVLQDVPDARDVDVGRGLGSSDDKVLAMRLAKTLLSRGVGMHLSHFLFTDLCAYDHHSHKLPKVANYLTSDAFVEKFASLLALYTKPLDARRKDRCLLEEAVLGRIHVKNTGVGDPELRKRVQTEETAMLPMFVPRCAPFRMHTSVADVDSYHRVASDAAALFAITEGANESTLHANCGGEFGMEWLSLYAHCGRSGAQGKEYGKLDTRNGETWPSEYRKLHHVLPSDSFVSVLSKGVAPSYKVHVADVFPIEASRREEWIRTASDPAHCFTYRVFRDAETSTKIHVQSVADHGVAPDRPTSTLMDVKVPSDGSSAYVHISKTYAFDDAAGALTEDGKAVVRTYASQTMPRMLSASGASREAAHFARQYLEQGDANTVGGTLGIGHQSMTLDGKHAWVSSSSDEKPTTGPVRYMDDLLGDMETRDRGARTSAWARYGATASWMTLSTIRHVGLHPDTAYRFGMHQDFLFSSALRTPDVTDELGDESEATERTRVNGASLRRMIHRPDESHVGDFADKGVFDKFFKAEEGLGSRLEDVALQCFNAHDYALQMNDVVVQCRNRYAFMFDAPQPNGTLFDEIVNDHPFALRLLVEMDATLGVAPMSAPEERRARLAAHPLMCTVDALFGGKLFVASGLSADGPVTEKRTFRGTKTAQDAAYRSTKGFYMSDPEHSLFASRVKLTGADASRKYTMNSPDISHLNTDKSKDGTVRQSGPDAFMNNPNVTNGCLFFSMLDAAAMLYHMRKYHNSADAIRCVPRSESGRQQDRQHYSLRYLYEAFLASREHNDGTSTWEVGVRFRSAFPVWMLGGMSSGFWKTEHGYESDNQALQEDLCRVRRLGTMWATIGDMPLDAKENHALWVPLPLSEQHKLMKLLGLFDAEHGMPCNPWNDPKGPLRTVFRSSKHNAYRVTRKDARSFSNWQSALPYGAPSRQWRPFSLYGGDLVLADFEKHRVEKMSSTLAGTPKEATYKDLVRSRYGTTSDMGLAKRRDGDLDALRDMSYFSDLEPDGAHRMVSYFMNYARNLTTLGLACSATNGKNEFEEGKFYHAWYGMYLKADCTVNAEHLGHDDVPIVMGYYVSPGTSRVVYVASTLMCMQNKLTTLLATLPSKDSHDLRKHAPFFTQVSSVIDEAVSAAKRKKLYEDAYEAVKKQDSRFEGTEGELLYYKRLVNLKNEHVDFLHRLGIAMMVKAGVKLDKLPIGALEAKPVDPTDVLREDVMDKHGLGVIHSPDLSSGAGHHVSEPYLTREAMQIRSLMPPGDAAVTALLGLRYHTRSPTVPEHDTTHLDAVETLQKHEWEAFATAMLNKHLGIRKLSVSAPALAMSPKRSSHQKGSAYKVKSKASGMPHRSSHLERDMNAHAMLGDNVMVGYRKRLHAVGSKRVEAAANKVLRETLKSYATGLKVYSMAEMADEVKKRRGKGNYGLDDPVLMKQVMHVLGGNAIVDRKDLISKGMTLV